MSGRGRRDDGSLVDADLARLLRVLVLFVATAMGVVCLAYAPLAGLAVPPLVGLAAWLRAEEAKDSRWRRHAAIYFAGVAAGSLLVFACLRARG
jgi:hypothetical protein